MGRVGYTDQLSELAPARWSRKGPAAGRGPTPVGGTMPQDACTSIRGQPHCHLDHPSASDQEPLSAAVAAARDGRSEAWELIYRTLYPRMFAYAKSRLGPDMAKEAVAETMARAVATIYRFTWNDSDFEAWMFGILRHVVSNCLRQSARQGRVARRAVEPEVPDPVFGLLADEEARAMRAAFAQLSEADQDLLRLRVVAGVSSDSVASILGRRPGAVRMAQSRALGRLRGLFEAMSS